MLWGSRSFPRGKVRVSETDKRNGALSSFSSSPAVTAGLLEVSRDARLPRALEGKVP